MSKRKKDKSVPRIDILKFNTDSRTIEFDGHTLTADTLRAFFGLAKLGKIMQFGYDNDGKLVTISRVPEGIENLVTELRRVIRKNDNDPVKGFKEIKWTLEFAEKVGLKENNLED